MSWWRLDKLLDAFAVIALDESTPAFLRNSICERHRKKLLFHPSELNHAIKTLEEQQHEQQQQKQKNHVNENDPNNNKDYPIAGLFVTAKYSPDPISHSHDHMDMSTSTSTNSISAIDVANLSTCHNVSLSSFPHHTLVVVPIYLTVPNALLIQLSYTCTHKLLFIPATMKIPSTVQFNVLDTIYYYMQLFTESSISKYVIPAFVRRNPDLLSPSPPSPSMFQSLFQYFARPLDWSTTQQQDQEDDVDVDGHGKQHPSGIVSPVNGLVVAVIDTTISSHNRNKRFKKDECINETHSIKKQQDHDALWVTVKGDIFGVGALTSSCPYVCNLYLRPSDYHHFHSPVTGYITNIYGYKGGREYLFNTQHTKYVDKYWYAIQQNTKLTLEFIYGPNNTRLYMIIIGGKYINCFHLDEMILLSLYSPSSFDDQPASISCSSSIRSKCYVTAGQDLGFFTFGSSIVLCSEQQWNTQLYQKSFCHTITVGEILSTTHTPEETH